MEVVFSEDFYTSINEIYSFWEDYTKSTTYSKKINLEIKNTIEIIKSNPNGFSLVEIGSEIKNIRSANILGVFSLFYQVRENDILILLLWDNRRNPQEVNFD